MLPAPYLTLLISLIFTVLALALCALISRVSLLHGSVGTRALTHGCADLMRSFPAAAWYTIPRWSPVGVLLVMAVFAASIGLQEIALLSLAAAIIAQLYRYDFPAVFAVSIALGWSPRDVILHRCFVLPVARRLVLVGSGICLCGGASQFSAGTVEPAASIAIVTGIVATIIASRAALTDALRLERSG